MSEKIERLKEQIRKVRAMRQDFLNQNCFMSLHKCDAKIAELEAKLHDAEMYEPVQLREILSSDELSKNNIYGKLLKINLAADFLNDVTMDCRQALKKLGVGNMHFQKDLDEIFKLSARVADLISKTSEEDLTDFIVNDDEFIEACHAAANKHLDSTFKLKA